MPTTKAKDPEMTLQEVTLSTDQDPAVLAATVTRDAKARALTAAKAEVARLFTIIAPRPTRIETPVTTPVLAFTQGEGFRIRDHAYTATRVEEPAVDLPAMRRAQLAMPTAELAVLEAQTELDESEAALTATRQQAWAARVPAADAMIKTALADAAKDVERAAAAMQKIADVLIPELNAKLGRDARGAERYHAAAICMPALVCADARCGSLADVWRQAARQGGWLP